MRIFQVRDYPAFVELRPRWNRLVDRARPDDFFLRHEWLDAAWAWRGREADLRVLCVEAADELVAALPLVAVRRRLHGIDCRVLEFLAIPDTQACDVILDPAAGSAAPASLAGALDDDGDWDLLSIDKVDAGSADLRKLADQLHQRGLAVDIEPAGANLYIDMADGWDAFYATRSRRLKKGNNHTANKLQRAFGKVALERFSGPDLAGQAPADLVQLVSDVSARSWKVSTGSTMDNPGPLAFLTTLVGHGCDQGWLSIWCLRLDEEVAAVELQVDFHGRIYALRADVDRRFDAHSPGTFANWKILQRHFETGARAYYFGPGENPYKQRWTDQGLPLRALTAYGPTARGRLLKVLRRRALPALRGCRRWVQGLRGNAAAAD